LSFVRKKFFFEIPARITDSTKFGLQIESNLTPAAVFAFGVAFDEMSTSRFNHGLVRLMGNADHLNWNEQFHVPESCQSTLQEVRVA
jgi:hypothetical protein